MKKHVHHFINCIKSIVVFPFWFLLYLSMMLLASFFPKITNSATYKWADGYYGSIIKPALTGTFSSRTSFTLAHGLVHFIILLFSMILVFQFYHYQNQSTAVKNKNLNIEARSYCPNGQIKENTNDLLEGFYMVWDNSDISDISDCVSDLTKMDDKSIYFHFIPGINSDDTTFYRIAVHADYNLRIDTAEIRSSMQKEVANHIFDYEIEHFGEENGKYYIVINLISLPLRDFTGTSNESSVFREFSFAAHPELYDEDDPPYLNYYFHYYLDLKSWVEDTIPNGKFFFSFWNEENQLIVDDSVVISNTPYFKAPYELIDIKPTPEVYSPYYVGYSGKTFEDALDGVYLKFVNYDLQQKKEREAFLYTVLFGALVSFLLTILIELFTKWRNLNLRSGNKDPYEENS